MKKLVIAALLASALAGPASAAELVVNGGFEGVNGLQNGWSHSVSSTLALFTLPAQAHSGDKLVRFTAQVDYLSDVLYQTLDTVPGETYTWSYWLKGDTTDPSAPSNFHGLIGTQSIGYFNFSGEFGWQHFTGTYVATSSQTDIYFQGFNSGGFYMLDDVSVTGFKQADIDLPGGPTFPGGGAVPEPATWAMMLLGFFTVGATLRRRTADHLAATA